MSRDLSWKLGFLLIAGFWALVSLGDYPAPFIDDMFFIGAALNLAQHGVFSNPYCEMLATIGSADHFFAYMPVHDYFLAGWLRLFGISTLSFHVLYTLLALGVSLLIYRLFPVTTWSWAAAIFIVLAVYGLLGGVGLRADSLGLFFLLLGFDAWRARAPFPCFWRNLFLGLVVITFPNVAIVALLLSLLGLVYQKFFQEHTFKELIPLVVAMAAAYAICFVLFMVLIDGRLTDFLTGLAKNQQMGAKGVHDRFQFFTALGISKWVVAQISYVAVALGLMWRCRKDRQRNVDRLFLIFSLVVFVAMGLSSVNSASGAHVWAFGCLMALLFLIVREKRGVVAWMLYGAVFAVAAFGHAHVAIQHVLADRGPDPVQRQALRDEITKLAPPRLYLDAYAVRELYNYQLPSETFAFETASTTGWSFPASINDAPKNAVLVTSVASSFPTARSPDAGKSARTLTIFGRPISGVRENPYQLEIIDTRD